MLIIGTHADGTPNAMNTAWAPMGFKRDHDLMGSHATTDNLNRCGDFTIAFRNGTDDDRRPLHVGITSARHDHDKITMPGCENEMVKKP